VGCPRSRFKPRFRSVPNKTLGDSVSVQALSAVLSLPGDLVTPAERLVLISIANHANKEGQNSYPAQLTICEETGLSRATVIRAVRRLKWLSLLTVSAKPARGPDGRFDGSVVYALNVPGLVDNSPSVGHGDARTVSQTVSHGESVTKGTVRRRKGQRQKSYPQAFGEVLGEMGFNG
jgi:Helix-turn-helix domain